MSSILDALKKSERQRSLGRDLIFRNASANAAPRLTVFAVAVLATLLLLALAIGALLFSLREPVLPPPASTSVETPAPSTVSGTGADPVNTSTAAPASAARTEMVPALDSQAHARIQATPLPEKSARSGAPSSADTRPVTGTGEAPWLSSLPPAFRSSLPPLSVNIHVYSPDQSQRILYINNRQARQGERIEGGVVVEEIVHDGVVLQYRGQRFKLPRPS
ncbi:MAG TPA: general secretion pathway protein GspB [Acidiferrobacterales bacterium]|nr:general secretion pathway protein GspB [Acidiferrobacterales bacterium]